MTWGEEKSRTLDLDRAYIHIGYPKKNLIQGFSHDFFLLHELTVFRLGITPESDTIRNQIMQTFFEAHDVGDNTDHNPNLTTLFVQLTVGKY